MGVRKGKHSGDRYIYAEETERERERDEKTIKGPSRRATTKKKKDGKVCDALFVC